MIDDIMHIFQMNEQRLSKRITLFVTDSTVNNNQKTPEEKKAAKFYKQCNNYGRSDRNSVLSNLHSLVKQLSKNTLTSTDRTTEFETLVASLNKMNSWPIFRLLPRASTDNETVIAVSRINIYLCF